MKALAKLRRAAGVLTAFKLYLLMAILALALWDTMLLKPFRIFVVMVHEICHAAAALVTGGEVVELRAAWDESGHTLTQGGVFPAITSAGYVGSSLLGSALIAAGSLPQLQRLVLLAIGAVTMGMTMRYTPAGQPDFYLGILGGLLLVSLAIKSQRAGRAGAICLGVMLCLYSLYDFRTDLWQHPELTDAGILAEYWGIPLLAYPIALAWVAISVAVMYWAMRSLVRHRGSK